jgi:hypothetical protein
MGENQPNPVTLFANSIGTYARHTGPLKIEVITIVLKSGKEGEGEGGKCNALKNFSPHFWPLLKFNTTCFKSHIFDGQNCLQKPSVISYFGNN